jgi:Ca2+/Na+ antiporter
MHDDERAILSTRVGIFAISLISFYVHAVVTDERLLPALNVIATGLNIPNELAGATIMAAGASAPVFFVSAVALFTANSPLGLGVRSWIPLVHTLSSS